MEDKLFLEKKKLARAAAEGALLKHIKAVKKYRRAYQDAKMTHDYEGMEQLADEYLNIVEEYRDKVNFHLIARGAKQFNKLGGTQGWYLGHMNSRGALRSGRVGSEPIL